MNDQEFRLKLKEKLAKQIVEIKPKAIISEYHKGLLTAYENVIWLIDIS
jgi:bifunctional ADP-heptose synthase (sugar kinase/adenylyltransferase)